MCSFNCKLVLEHYKLLLCCCVKIVSVFLFTDVPTLVEFIHSNLPSAAIVSAKALVAYPFFYHLCNGVRHLVSYN